MPLGTKDFASTIAALPDDVDAIYLGLGGGDAVNFLNQYQQAGGKAHLLGGSIMVDQTILSAKGNAKNAMIGTIAASGMADTWDDPGWKAFVKLYQDATPADKRLPSPGLLATNYYDATMAMYEALNKVNGDLSDNQNKLKEALAAPDDRRAQRQDQARRQPPGDRHQLRHRSRRGRQGRPGQQGREGRARTSTRRSATIRARVRQDRPAEPHQSGVQEVLIFAAAGAAAAPADLCRANSTRRFGDERPCFLPADVEPTAK